MTARLRDCKHGTRLQDGTEYWTVREGGQHFVSFRVPRPGGAVERFTIPLDRAEAAAHGRIQLDVQIEWPEPEPTPPPLDTSNGVPTLEDWEVDTDVNQMPPCVERHRTSG